MNAVHVLFAFIALENVLNKMGIRMDRRAITDSHQKIELGKVFKVVWCMT